MSKKKLADSKLERRGSGEIVPQHDCKAYFPDEELGACGKCHGYQDLKPHKRVGEEGVVFITCKSSNAMVQVRTDLSSPEGCEFFSKSVPRHH